MLINSEPIVISAVGVTAFLVIFLGAFALAFIAVLRNAALVISKESAKRELTKLQRQHLDVQVEHHIDRNRLRGAYEGIIVALRNMDEIPDSFYDDLSKNISIPLVEEIKRRVADRDLDPHFDTFEYPFTLKAPMNVKLGDILRCGSTMGARSSTPN
jgi:hypothetical protein